MLAKVEKDQRVFSAMCDFFRKKIVLVKGFSKEILGLEKTFCQHRGSAFGVFGTMRPFTRKKIGVLVFRTH